MKTNDLLYDERVKDFVRLLEFHGLIRIKQTPNFFVLRQKNYGVELSQNILRYAQRNDIVIIIKDCYIYIPVSEDICMYPA